VNAQEFKVEATGVGREGGTKSIGVGEGRDKVMWLVRGCSQTKTSTDSPSRQKTSCKEIQMPNYNFVGPKFFGISAKSQKKKKIVWTSSF
jgi:hypothetical protein